MAWYLINHRENFTFNFTFLFDVIILVNEFSDVGAS